MADKKRKGHLPPFIPVIRATSLTPAWKATSLGARWVYIVLRGFLRHDNANNGKVFRSSREIHNDLGRGTLRSIGRWLRELEHYGFIVQTSGPHLGAEGYGIAPHWRLTECPSFDGKGNMIAATRDFDRWNGCPFVDAQKTESPIPEGSGVHPSGLHRAEAETGEIAPNCIPQGHIDSPPNCIPQGYITCCHSPLPSAAPTAKAVSRAGPSLPRLRLAWSTPTLVEVVDEDDKAAILKFWTPKVA